MDTKLFLTYLELLKKYNQEDTSEEEKNELVEDMNLIRLGYLPCKYLQ